VISSSLTATAVPPVFRIPGSAFGALTGFPMRIGRARLDLFPAPNLVVPLLDRLDHRGGAFGLHAGQFGDLVDVERARLDQLAKRLVQRRGVTRVADGEDDPVREGPVVVSELL